MKISKQNLLKMQLNFCRFSKKYVFKLFLFVFVFENNFSATMFRGLSTLLQLVLCSVAALKISPISSIVQIIFSFWSLEISEGIPRNQKYIIGLDSFSIQRFIYLTCLDNTSLCLDSPVESCKNKVIHFGLFCHI